MSLYEFKQEDAERFAQSVGAKTKYKGKELEFRYCPLCHGGSSRDIGTFSINMNTGQCECKRSSCGYRGNMITLARDLGFELSEGVVRYYNINNYNGKFKKFSEGRKETTDKAIEYLKSRGISEEVARKYEITTKTGQDNVLVFPFRGSDGQLKFIKYRNIEFVKGKTQGAKEWCEANCMPILFGMNHCNLENDTLILTEGQIDSLSVAEAGIENAISVPTGMNGFTWIGHCWDWVHKFKKIIVFGDREGDTITLLDTIKNRFNLAIKYVAPESYGECKDANEILQRYGKDRIRLCIESARDVPVTNVNDLSGVKSINIYETEKLATGIGCVDKFLFGGLPFGGITNIIGKTGEGKSTLASQIIAQALNQNYKCFIYSGELSNSSYKESMDRQLAGIHVKAYQDETVWHNTHYMIPQETLDKLNKWYAGRCSIYSDSVEDDYEPLLKTIENSIQQNETRVILIDNLMTALDLQKVEGNDRYEKQSLFVKSVARIANKYNVLILLVAHKRKDGGGDENDQIMGSSDIGNLSMVTLSYGRDDKIPDYKRKIKISKNRLFGNINTNGWELDYDTASKRIFGANDDSKMEYGWITDSDGFVPSDDYNDIPF